MTRRSGVVWVVEAVEVLESFGGQRSSPNICSTSGVLSIASRVRGRDLVFPSPFERLGPSEFLIICFFSAFVENGNLHEPVWPVL